MDRAYLLEVARRERGLTQAQLAKRSGTSQAALSAYERGLKSPSLKVASRILEAAGFDLNLRVHIDWKEHHPTGIVAFWAPNILWTVETPDCFATLEMPDLIRNTGMRDWDMRDREQRKGLRAADSSRAPSADDSLGGRCAARRCVGRARSARSGPRSMDVAHPVGPRADETQHLVVRRGPVPDLDRVDPWL